MRAFDYVTCSAQVAPGSLHGICACPLMENSNVSPRLVNPLPIIAQEDNPFAKRALSKVAGIIAAWPQPITSVQQVGSSGRCSHGQALQPTGGWVSAVPSQEHAHSEPFLFCC